MIKALSVRTPGQGLLDITDKVQSVVAEAARTEGLCTIFVQHTSASLIIQENADPSAQKDLERWLNRLVPERDALYTHTMEGTDDMPSHIKSMLTQVSISIPIHEGRLVLGTWQGIYLWEHRRATHQRSIIIQVG